MTPGLGGFVVAGDAAPAWDEALAAAQSALEPAFTVTEDRGAAGSGHHRRTFLDTFDRRLHRAGYVLEYVPTRHGAQLRLSSSIGDCLTQPVTGWRPGRFARDLPDGEVAERVAPIVRPRALLPLATVSTQARVARLLNNDGKTVARLITSHVSVATAAGTTELRPRLDLAEVRGYVGQARRAARIIADVPGLEAATATLAETVLDAAGTRAPAAASGITARMPGTTAVALGLLGLLDALEANVAGVLQDIDIEFLHDLRVAVRRTRSALKLLGDVLPRGYLDRFAADFKWLSDLTTPTRDLDVHLLGFGQMVASLQAAPPEDLAPLRVFLERDRELSLRRLRAGLRSARFRALTEDWRKALIKARDATPRRSVPPTGELAAERIRRAFRKVVRRGAAITDASPAESLHDLRKRCKELRYACEFFAPIYDAGEYGKVIGDLKRLQDCLGEFQDTQVQIDEIRALATEMAGPIPTLLAMGELTAGLARRQRAARSDFERRFAAFAGPAGQLRIHSLLNGSAA
jgi:CHAD domain-containing protein